MTHRRGLTHAGARARRLRFIRGRADQGRFLFRSVPWSLDRMRAPCGFLLFVPLEALRPCLPPLASAQPIGDSVDQALGDGIVVVTAS